MKLLCDHMLGSLAKWLRIFGYDTFYPTSETSDAELLAIAQKENRLVISRDRELIARGKKKSLAVLEIHTTDLNEQLTLVLHHIGFDTSKMLTRCIVCNTPLLTVEKHTVKTQVPSKVFETRDAFWFCSVCNKYYWMGTHYENMTKKINDLQKQTGSS
jgi:uncharacterized protein with PIN domain